MKFKSLIATTTLTTCSLFLLVNCGPSHIEEGEKFKAGIGEPAQESVVVNEPAGGPMDGPAGPQQPAPAAQPLAPGPEMAAPPGKSENPPVQPSQSTPPETAETPPSSPTQTPTPPPSPQPPASTPATSTPANVNTDCGPMTGTACDIFKLVNEQRVQHGLPSLRPYSRCVDAAISQSQDMADHHFFDHKSPTHGSFKQRARDFNLAAGNNGNYGYAENIAFQTGSSNTLIVNLWMDSPGHSANILNDRYYSGGVGFARSANGDRYYTQCFYTGGGD